MRAKCLKTKALHYSQGILDVKVKRPARSGELRADAPAMPWVRPEPGENWDRSEKVGQTAGCRDLNLAW